MVLFLKLKSEIRLGWIESSCVPSEDQKRRRLYITKMKWGRTAQTRLLLLRVLLEGSVRMKLVGSCCGLPSFWWDLKRSDQTLNDVLYLAAMRLVRFISAYWVWQTVQRQLPRETSMTVFFFFSSEPPREVQGKHREHCNVLFVLPCTSYKIWSSLGASVGHATIRATNVKSCERRTVGAHQCSQHNF